jgi:hypothetical protein
MRQLQPVSWLYLFNYTKHQPALLHYLKKIIQNSPTFVFYSSFNRLNFRGAFLLYFFRFLRNQHDK